MDQQYEEAVRTTEELRGKIQDTLDDPDHSSSQQLLEDAERLNGDTRNKKNPRTLEDQAEGIIRLLQQKRGNSEQTMSSHDIDFLIKRYEELRMSFRKFENY